MTGQSKCYGFVSFKEHDQAEAACEVMNGKEIEGKVSQQFSNQKSLKHNFSSIVVILQPCTKEGRARR